MRILILAVGLFGASSPALAQDPAAQAKNWKNAAELTVLNTTGNSRVTTYGASDLFTATRGKASAEVKGGALGSKTQGTTTAEQYNAGEKVSWALSERYYVFERFGWDKNRFAGIRNRYEPSAGLGALAIKTPKDTLAAELGAGYVSEERIGSPSKSFASGRAYAKYAHVFNEAVNFSQDAEYLRDFSDGRNYRLNTETAFISAMSTHLSLKASYKWKRVNAPPLGFVKDDTFTALALIVNY
ncbi:MAG: DUF481 domain-containing protein [Elusimicrobia bacterium]|nr:DUF481 domain-containing protein [Elusimicrobiota bacterium]